MEFRHRFGMSASSVARRLTLPATDEANDPHGRVVKSNPMARRQREIAIVSATNEPRADKMTAEHTPHAGRIVVRLYRSMIVLLSPTDCPIADAAVSMRLTKLLETVAQSSPIIEAKTRHAVASP
jgi:hypothetical protein